MIPFLKFYIEENPEFGKPKKPFIKPSLEEFEEMKDMVGWEAIKDYDRYVQRLKDEHEKEVTRLQVNKVAIATEEDIKMTENKEGFVRWIGSNEKIELTGQQRKIVEKIREQNRQKTIKTDIFGNKQVDMKAVALTQDLEKVINRARQINNRDVA